MAALSLTTSTVKDGSGSSVTTNVADNGTGKSPAAAILGADGAHFLPSGDDPTRPIYTSLADGTTILGTAAHPLRTDPVGTTTQPIADIPQASGGFSAYSFLSTAAVQAANLKNAAGQLYSIEFFNISATPVYVRVYDKATSPLTSDTPILRFVVPGNTAGAGFVKSWDKGIPVTTGLGIRVTAGIADNDATALTASTVAGNVEYK